MARLIYARAAFADLDRVARHVEDQGPDGRQAVIDRIGEAVAVLRRHPLIGRLVEDGYRELVISRGKSGYVALYRYDVEDDRVVVLGIRAQREAGYQGE